METSKEASSPESGQANFQSEPEAEAGNLLAEMSLEPKPEGSSNTSRKQHSEVRDGMKDVSTDVEEDGVVANFVTDVIGSGAMPQTRFSPPRIRASSPTPSDSSEEVVLFQGRIAPAVLTVSDHSTINFPHSQTSAKPQLQRKPDGIASASKVAAPRRESQWGSRGSTSGRSRGDDVLADYIANMQENGYLDEQITDAEQEPNEIGHPNEPKGMYDNLACNDPVGEKKLTHGIPHHDWSDLDLKDFNEFSTSESVLGHVQEIISKRYRESGPQYLVIWEGSTVDDARWVSSASLTMEGAAAQIAAFEKIYRNTEEISESEDELEQIQGDESEESDELSGEDEEEDLLDNQDLIERKLERMTDEKLARLLSKQEELGMGSNELLLFDDGEENEENIGLQNFSDVSGIGRTKRSRQTSRISGRRQVGFPSASALAAAFEDDYGDFDIMDRERASIVTKPKHRNQVLPFQLSDSELEATLKSNWDNDRKKKRARKAEREELRAQGLIGSKGKNKSNLRVKYDQGMTLEDVRKELGEFLDSERDSLSLPPLDKRDRKIVHEIANSVGLKSKSTGSGSNRFPILYKTSKSDFFEDSDLDVVIARLKQRRFLPRLDKRSKKGTGPARRSGGVAHLGVSYRDGDVVGASAPELGVENKGRAMLEKMGWSTGTALGALNNKGILQPVVHVVKTSKAGLG